MAMKNSLRLFLAFALILFNLAAPAFAQTQNRAIVRSFADDMDARLAALERKIEAKRQELGVPGASLVIIKDDKVIYLKGLGYKDFERKLPATPDTLFAIGSCTKAFTAMAVMMSVDAGKMSLDDPPRKFLPYFKLQDPETDAKITIRNLLSHSSGLNRTDLAWVSGKFNREEIIKIAAQAKPVAKLNEKFLYQNIMFAAAGEALAKANETSYENFITERIFKPLGMKQTNLTYRQMQESPDHALGYEYVAATKETIYMPMRNIDQIAPAGSINSNAREMAEWLRLMLGGGVFAGKRLVSEKSFNELITPQMKIQGNTSYGLGWFLRDWNGHKVAEHGGNIDGFSAQVAFMPDQKLGFALLTNQNDSALPAFAMNTIWTQLVGGGDTSKPVTANDSSNAKVEAQTEAGSYKFAEAGFNVEIAFKDGKLMMSVPGQPTYPLENIGGRRYKLGAPAPNGFFITFRAAKDNPTETEAYLEQPQGNYVLKKIKPADLEMDKAAYAKRAEQLKELIGSYKSEKGEATVEIALKDDKVSLVAPAQPPYPLIEKEHDTFALSPLPDNYRLIVRRDASGKVEGLTIKQPEGEFSFKRTSASEFKPPLTVDELMSKVIEAAGGEANWRKHHSMTTIADVDFENQGVQGVGVITAKAPNMADERITLTALGREFGALHEYFDGARGGEEGTFLPRENYAGRKLAQARLNADFYQLLDWKTLYKKVEIKRMDKINGEDVFVVIKTPTDAPEITDYISAKTFLVIKRDSIELDNASEMSIPTTETFSDFRNVGGIMLPFKTIQHTPTMGDIVIRIKEIKFDTDIPDATFRASAMK